MRRGWATMSTLDIINRVHGTSARYIDLTGSTACQEGTDARGLLGDVPVKFISFHEDIRPPYVGTFSKFKNSKDAFRLGRRPVAKTREELDYEYDSEAEWEEPEEGEELGSEGEEDEESVADTEELEEFLDDEGAEEIQKPKKKLPNGDMQPTSTGVCWQDEAERFLRDTRDLPVNPQNFSLESLLGELAFSRLYRA